MCCGTPLEANFRIHRHHSNIVLDFTPKTNVDKVLVLFQRMDLIEKIMEVVDETFHLLQDALKIVASAEIFIYFRDIHEGAHNIEHALHTFCFIGDLTRLYAGKYIVYQEENKTKIDFIRTASRIIHTVSHFFATMETLVDLKIINAGPLDTFIRYRRLISSLAFSLWAGTLISQFNQNKEKALKDQNFNSDLAIHGGGAIFEGFAVIKKMVGHTGIAYVMGKIAALAGIIHAYHTAQRLIPNDKIEFSENKIPPKNDCHHHCHHHHDEDHH